MVIMASPMVSSRMEMSWISSRINIVLPTFGSCYDIPACGQLFSDSGKLSGERGFSVPAFRKRGQGWSRPEREADGNVLHAAYACLLLCFCIDIPAAGKMFSDAAIFFQEARKHFPASEGTDGQSKVAYHFRSGRAGTSLNGSSSSRIKLNMAKHLLRKK